MGLFDRFKGDKDGGKGPTLVPADSPAAKWAEKAGDKRAQNYDRQEAISKLAEMASADAAAALIRRFTFNIDPSITDQEEKDAAYAGILACGQAAIDPVRTFAEKAESLAWPMKIFKDLLEEDAFIEELVLWLSRWDTEYRKFIDPKLQILTELEQHKSPKIREAVEPFLVDVNEPARFHAVVTTLAQEDAEAVGPLIDALVEEESFRVKTKLAEGLLVRAWPIAADKRDVARKALPPGYTVDGDGRVKKR
jgi:HEAT repeat protein